MMGFTILQYSLSDFLQSDSTSYFRMAVVLWNIDDLIQVCKALTNLHGQNLKSLDFSPSGDSLVSASLNGSIFLSDISSSSWRRKAEFIVNREFSDLEMSEYIVLIIENED